MSVDSRHCRDGIVVGIGTKITLFCFFPRSNCLGKVRISSEVDGFSVNYNLRVPSPCPFIEINASDPGGDIHIALVIVHVIQMGNNPEIALSVVARIMVYVVNIKVFAQFVLHDQTVKRNVMLPFC